MGQLRVGLSEQWGRDGYGGAASCQPQYYQTGAIVAVGVAPHLRRREYQNPSDMESFGTLILG